MPRHGFWTIPRQSGGGSPFMLVSDSVRTWFSEPTVLEYSGGIFFAGVNSAGTVVTDRYDINTQTTLQKNTSAVGFEIDDHNNGCVFQVNGGYIGRIYQHHYDAAQRFKVTDRPILSASDWAAASWSSETHLFTASDATRYSYSNTFKLSQTGDKVYFIYRKGLDPDPQAECKWCLRTLDNAHTSTPTVGSELVLWENPGQFPYAKFDGNGVDRIDIIGNNVVVAGAASLYHGYIKLNGSNVFEFFKTDGTSVTGPLTPSNATLVNSGATQMDWVSDVKLDSNGRPRICYPKYPANDETDVRARVASWTGSVWNDVEVMAEGAGIQSASPTGGIYPGAHCVHPLDANKIIVSGHVSGVRQIREFITSDGGASFSLNREITTTDNTGSGHVRMRPRRVEGSTGFCNIVWVGDSTYTTFDNFNIDQWGIA